MKAAASRDLGPGRQTDRHIRTYKQMHILVGTNAPTYVIRTSVWTCVPSSRQAVTRAIARARPSRIGSPMRVRGRAAAARQRDA